MLKKKKKRWLQPLQISRAIACSSWFSHKVAFRQEDILCVQGVSGCNVSFFRNILTKSAWIYYLEKHASVRLVVYSASRVTLLSYYAFKV